MNVKSCRVILTLFEVILGISATTHWVVTEHGRIQPQVDSAFQMTRPYDLLSFMEQEKYRGHIDSLYKRVMARKAAIDKQWIGLDSATDVENRLYSFDHDCLMAGKTFADLDLYASVVTDGSNRKGVSKKDFLLDGIPYDGKQKVPDCKKTFPLDFSMHTFEHLSSMRNRKNLTQHQEKSLLKHLPPGTDLSKFGHQIAYGLYRNSTSWLHLNLAAIYWRGKGDAYNALECARRAIVAAPMRYRDIPLLTTGGILHAAKESSDAAIVLQTSVAYAPEEVHHHFALGHVYAILGDYNRSIDCYENSLKLSPNWDQARDIKHAILCHQKLENSLIALNQRLLDILAELHAFHSEQEEMIKLQEKMMWDKIVQAPFLKLRSGLDEGSSSSLLANQGQACTRKGEDDSIVSCDFTSDRQMLAHNLQTDIGVSLQLLKKVENQSKKISEQMIRSKLLYYTNIEDIKEQKTTMGYLKEFYSVFMEPTGRPKYYNLEVQKSSEMFEDPDWPSESYCENLMPFATDVKQYVPVYLPPENKGYVTYIFLSDLIAIEPDKEHPLPWYPPICTESVDEKVESFDEQYFPAELLKASSGYNVPESSLMPMLASLVEGAEIAEIGQRILTAMKSKVAAPWVLSMLASLHWRVVGKPRNALDCLQLALKSAPTNFRDVPLVSIASISHKFNLIDNALAATEEALNINSVEPLTNFLQGSLLYLKRNYSGAIHHLKQTLRVEPMDYNAMTMLKNIACQERYGLKESEPEIGDTTAWCIGTRTLQDKSGRYNPSDDETILCDSEGKNCRHVQCFAVKTDTDVLSGVCSSIG